MSSPSDGAAAGSGPLAHLRVLELGTGIPGAYAGRLLAMLGADVTRRVEARLPPALELHLDTGKRRRSPARLDLAREVAASDVVIDDRARPEHAAARVLVTTSPWGLAANDPGAPQDELLVQAAAGVLCTTGDPDGPPLRFPGHPSQYLAGAYAAAAALAALRLPGVRHVDVPWVWAMATGIEASWARALQTGFRAPPGGPHDLDIFPSGALPCADGFVSPGTIRPQDWVGQCRVYGRPELIRDERFRSRGRRRRHWQALWTELEPWYRAHTRREIFEAALREGWALGMVLRGADLEGDPHLRERGFLGEVTRPEGGSVRAPVQPWRAPGLPAGDARLRAVDEPEPDASARPATSPAARPPLRDVRVLELTQAWAGPFVGRMLGALGADVIKIESARRPDGWRGPTSFGQMAPDLGRPADALSVEIASNFNTINRNKRSCSIDLTRDAGRRVFLDLVARADAVVVNMTAAVLPRLGLDDAALRAVNPGIVLVNMPALGASGPYRDAAGYGSIVEGMGGFGALFGAPEEGARISQTYYPDPVAGLHAALALLSMLERRDRTGQGGEVDLSHQETLWLQFGDAIVAPDTPRAGNHMPGAATSGVFPTRDGRWLAVVSDRPCAALLARSHERAAPELAAELRAAGARVTEVLHFLEARQREPLAGAVERLHHEVTGQTDYLRVPWIVDGKPLDSRAAAPVCDRDTRSVLREVAGYDDARIDALRAEGAVGGRPDPEALVAFFRDRARGGGPPRSTDGSPSR